MHASTQQTRPDIKPSHASNHATARVIYLFLFIEESIAQLCVKQKQRVNEQASGHWRRRSVVVDYSSTGRCGQRSGMTLSILLRSERTSCTTYLNRLQLSSTVAKLSHPAAGSCPAVWSCPCLPMRPRRGGPSAAAQWRGEPESSWCPSL